MVVGIILGVIVGTGVGVTGTGVAVGAVVGVVHPQIAMEITAISNIVILIIFILPTLYHPATARPVEVVILVFYRDIRGIIRAFFITTRAMPEVAPLVPARAAIMCSVPALIMVTPRTLINTLVELFP